MIDETPEEAVRGRVTTAITTGAYLAQGLARTTQQDAESVERASQARTHELVARLEADRAAAIAELAVVDHDEWWSTADAEQISSVRQTAEAWRQYDPAADRAARLIEDRLRDGGAGDWLDRQGDLAHARDDEQHTRDDEHQAAAVLSGAVTDAEVDAAVLEVSAASVEHDVALAQEDAAAAALPAWDSPERRAELDHGLEAAGVQQTP